MVPLRFLLFFLALKFSRSFNIDTSRNWVSLPSSPYFGHQVFPYVDGRQRWILVTSLGPGDLGRLYKCDVQSREIYCDLANLGESVQKLAKRQAGIALAQNSGQILTCLQQKRRQRRKATEELNGLCFLLSAEFQQEAFINLTAIIETQLNKNDWIRKRRSSTNGSNQLAACHNSEGAQMCKDRSPEFGYHGLHANNHLHITEGEEDESDLRTEIAIVLDGSGSIEPEDFERAKDFVDSMMKTIYEKCFECVFALVQYGGTIQTEFDLLAGRSAAALEKVRNMTQVKGQTWTASAIQHVLDSIFSPARGSKPNATKIIIVLTDGEIFLDELDLGVVISSTKMENIERFAIGVGTAFEKEKALQELRLIASHPDERHLFRVTNYSALNVLLATLQQKIIALEGTAGDTLEFELSQSGFSIHLLDERYILFGAVGAFDWSGGIILYDVANGNACFLNESKGSPGAKNGYLGYSVVAGKTRSGYLIVGGAPRHSMKGKVAVFEGGKLTQTLQGEQIGSYYGSELCLLDIDQDEVTDHLLVGAPFFHLSGEEGKVYSYHLDPETNLFALQGHLHSQPGLPFARFGFSMSSIGDIDRDGFEDVAVGAPMEDQASNPGCFGSVYIYNGKENGIHDSFSQRITAAQTSLPGLMYFGRSVAGGTDFTTDGLPDIVVGSLGKIILLRSRPVVRMEPTMQFSPEKILNFDNITVFSATLCLRATSLLETTWPGNLLIQYRVELDVAMENKRARFEDQRASAEGKLSYAENSCSELQGYILPCLENCFSSVNVKVNFSLQDLEGNPDEPLPVLNVYQQPEVYFQLPYADDCGIKATCTPLLNVSVRTADELVVGHTKELTMNIHLENNGGNSHLTSLVLKYPTNLHFTEVQEVSSSVVIKCSEPKPISILFSTLSCKVGHPVLKSAVANFSVTWQLDGKKFPNNTVKISLRVINANQNGTVLEKESLLRVKHAFSTILSRPLPVIYISVSEGSSPRTNFTFNVYGKNQFGAPLHLQIWVPVNLGNQQIASVKNTAATQHTTECRIKDAPSQKDRYDLETTKNSNEVKYQLVMCRITSEKENVTVTVQLLPDNSFQLAENRTELLIRGEILFNRDLYVGLNSENHKAEIRAVLLEEKVTDLLPFIAGSSVGGILLLLIIVAILYKCGFFKRAYKNKMEEEEEDS